MQNAKRNVGQRHPLFLKDEVVLLKDSLYRHAVGVDSVKPAKAIIRGMRSYPSVEGLIWVYQISEIATPELKRAVFEDKLSKLMVPALLSFDDLIKDCNKGNYNVH